MNLLPIDQLNVLKLQIPSMFEGDAPPSADDVVDIVLDLLIMSYIFGTEDAAEKLEATISPDVGRMEAAIYKRVAGKNFEERIREHTEAGDVAGILNVADTDMTRIYSTAVIDGAKTSGKPYRKRWQTMEDDRVRETHAFLQSVSVGADERFYTYDGDSARHPGDFTLPENNCGCRCYIELIPE